MSKETIGVKPAKEGLIVRDPVTMQPLPPHGKAVPRNSYWLRRLKAGDVVEAKEKKATDKDAQDDAKSAPGAPKKGGNK